VANVDIGMVIHLVCGLRNAVYEGDAIGESLEDESLRESVAAARPARQAAEGALNFEVGQFLPHRCEVVRVREQRYGSYRLRARPAIRRFRAHVVRAMAGVLVFTSAAQAQSADTASSPRYYWRYFTYGFAASILFHEA